MEVADAGDFTFIFVSTKGSARQWQEQPEAMQAAHAIYESACRRAVEEHGGEVFQVVNDDIYAAFVYANSALEAAVAIQKTLAAAAWPPPIDKLQAEVALHSGPGLVGNGVQQATPTLNRLSRIHAVTYPGQILLSADTARLVGNNGQGSAMYLRDLGERRLRDVPQPIHLYQFINADLPHDFPPLKTLDRRPNNLPAARTSFVGREQDIAAVGNLLRQPEIRLVTLSGPGGSGKTRLSLEVAADLLDEYEHGAFFVPLAPINDAALVASTIAHTLGLQEEGGTDITETLKQHLSDKQMLMVLDNFEQVVAAAPQLGELLQAAPKLKLLVSSRELLHEDGEHEYAVAPLALPLREHLPPDELMAYPVVKLFVQRAQAVRFDFTLTADNAAAVVEICTRLDGLPLAIELAAARSRELDPAAIVAQLSNRLTVLVSAMRDLPPRQRSLRGAIEWSYELLDEREKLLFRRLAVFVGGWDEQAAMEVCSDEDITTQEVAQLLEQLADKSLVQAQAQGQERRYLMLDTIREYALLVMVSEQAANRYTMQKAIQEYAQEQLATHGEEATLRERHATHYRGLAEQADKNLVGAEQAMWLNRLETDRDNLRAALSWLQGRGETEPMLRMVNAMWGYWYVRGYLREGREWLDSVLAMSVGQVNDLRARAFNSALALADEQNELRPAQEFGRQALEIARQLGDKKRLSATLNSMGIVSIKLGEYAAAQAQLREAMAIEQELGNSRRLGTVTGNLGAVAEAMGDYKLAHSMYEQSITLQRESGDTWGLANALLADAHIVIEEREFGVAMERLTEAQQLYEELGGKQGTANALTNLGRIAELENDLDTARSRYEQSLALMREMGRQGSVAANLGLIANVVRKQGDLAAAQAMYKQSLLVEQGSDELENMPHLLEGIAALLVDMEQVQAGAQLLAAAAALRKTLGQGRPPTEQHEVEQLTATVAGKLSAGELEAAQIAGSAMSAAAMIKYALAHIGAGNGANEAVGLGAIEVKIAA